MKKYSTTLVIKNTYQSHEMLHIKLYKIKKNDTTKCLQGYRATGTLTDFIGGSIKYKLRFRKGPSSFFKN